MTITELAIKRPSLLVVIFAVLSVLGVFGYNQLRYELIPKFTIPVVVVATVYPGAAPSEVENSVTKLIEDALSGLDNVKRVTASSQEGVSLVTVQFNQSAKPDIAVQEAQRRVNQIVSQLPADAKTPTVSKIALDEIPVVRMGLTGNIPPRDLYELAKEQIKPRLSRLEGVGTVFLVGGEEREIKVNINQDKVRGYGLSLAGVLGTLKASNLDFPTGNIKDAQNQTTVRVAGQFVTVEDIRNMIVGRSRNGGEVKFSDIAEVQDGTKELSNYVRLNGAPTIGVLVQKQSDANSVDVSRLVRKEIAHLEEMYKSKGIHFEISQDGSLFTIDAAHAVKVDLGIAVFLVAAVMFLFLHSVRNSFIVMLAIPSSMIGVFFFMYIMNFTLNLMTLLGLSLVVGILVDDSIVVLENIYHYLERGDDKVSAAIRGRNEIGFAALSITLVDVVVFLPLSFVSGLVGNIMREFALVVVGSTLMSLFVSFTITPMLASRIAKLEHVTNGTLMGRFALLFERGYNVLRDEYVKLLKWSLAHRKTVLGLTVVLFFGSFSLFAMGLIGFEFIAVSDRGEFSATVELPTGSSLENTNTVSLQAEGMIAGIPEVSRLLTNVGASSEGFLSQTSNNIAEFNVTLVPKDQRSRSTDEVGKDIKNRLLTIPGVKIRVNPIGLFGNANQTPIQIVASSSNQQDTKKAAQQIADILHSIPGTADIRLSVEDGKPENRVEIDREKMSALGLTIGDIGQVLRIALSGDNNSKFRQGQFEYDIRIQLDKFDRSNPDDLRRLTFMNNRGQLVELQQFAAVIQNNGPTKLQRTDRNGSITVFAQVVGRPGGTVVDEFRAKLVSNPLPSSVLLTYLGDEENRQEGFGSLGLAMMAGVLFVYLIMIALYDSYIYPFVVLFSIPVAVVGAFLALAMSGFSMSIFSILGFIMLIGLVAKNAILLVDRANDMKLSRGMSSYDALIEAGESRLRPILMTTVAMVLGMLPIAMSKASGAEWKAGLAWALVGGLSSSMLLTLVVVPIIFLKVDDWKQRFPAFWNRVFKRHPEEHTSSVAVFPQTTRTMMDKDV